MARKRGCKYGTRKKVAALPEEIIFTIPIRNYFGRFLQAQPLPETTIFSFVENKI